LQISIGVALALAIWAYIGIVLNLAPGLAWTEPLISGTITGLIVGDAAVGLSVGASLTLMSLGMHTFGGATIPDFFVGSILGTAFGIVTGSVETGLAIGMSVALLMMQLDVFGRGVNTVFIHAADKYVEDANWGRVTLMHILGHMPWGLTRAIPVFLALWLGQDAVIAFTNWVPQWFMDGIRTVGAILPALGFALLLGQMAIRKYLPFLIIGYVLFAYLGMSVIGISIVAVAIAVLYMQLKGGAENA
jgi:mannose/fructose/N-acetylgalactosamine-specific phosphotransferase system component IIC